MTMGRPIGYRKQFCPKGHDTFVVGREGGGCRVCRRERTKLQEQKNPEKKNKRSRENQWKNRNIVNVDGSPFTIVDYDRLYQIQQGRCVICKKHSTEFTRHFHVDHNHKTGEIRGLLCYHCNSAVGYYENKELNRKIEQFLKKEDNTDE
jgi:hypothetical protein